MLSPIEGFRVTAERITDSPLKQGVRLTIHKGPDNYYTEDYSSPLKGSLRSLRITRLINQGLQLINEGLSVASTVAGTAGLISLVGTVTGYEYHFPLYPAGIPVLYAFSVLTMLGSHLESQEVEKTKQKEQAIQQFLKPSRRPNVMQRDHLLPNQIRPKFLIP